MGDSAMPVAWVAVWAAGGAAIVIVHARRAPAAGLVAAYVLNLAMIHWLGAVVYTFPWYQGVRPDLVQAGFFESLVALVAFAAGALLVAPWVWLLASERKREPGATGPVSVPAVRYLTSGLAAYLFLGPLLGGVPTVSAIVSTAGNAMVVGLALAWWRAWRLGDGRRQRAWMAALLGLPVLTVVAQGFLGFGVVAALSALTFIASTYRSRRPWRVAVSGVLLAYLGLSVYVTYMRDRDELRRSVWGGDPVAARLQRVYLTATDLEWFDPYDDAHLRRIDGRLNQNFLVGAAMEYLGSGAAEPARGQTLWQAVIALIPRILWPDKPVVAGSMGLVSRYTGITFGPGTSVGMGHVLELYINFGTVGVVFGFLLLGACVGFVDLAAGERLRRGDWQSFVLWYLPGLSFLQVGGSLVELTASVGASAVTALLLNGLLVPPASHGVAASPRRASAPAPFAARRVRPATTGSRRVL